MRKRRQSRASDNSTVLFSLTGLELSVAKVRESIEANRPDTAHRMLAEVPPAAKRLQEVLAELFKVKESPGTGNDESGTDSK